MNILFTGIKESILIVVKISVYQKIFKLKL